MDHIEVPVRPHVLKFLQFYLGEKYYLSENDQFGTYLFSQLRRPMRDARRNHVLEGYKGKWKVHFGAISPKKLGLRLTGKGAQMFDKWVDSVMKTEMVGYVDLAQRYGDKIKYAIESYMGERGLREEDIQYETLYKHYQRNSQLRKATKKRVATLRPGRTDEQVQRELRRVPLPMPAAARPAA